MTKARQDVKDGKMDKWISVKDGLPKQMYEKLKYYSRRKVYIVCNNKGVVFAAYFNFESRDKNVKNYFNPIHYPRILKNITHWMPLPNPPEI